MSRLDQYQLLLALIVGRYQNVSKIRYQFMTNTGNIISSLLIQVVSGKISVYY